MPFGQSMMKNSEESKMKRYFLFLIICGTIFTVRISAAIMINVDNRNTTSLNGQWQYIVDPYENGYYTFHLKPQTTEGYFANQKPENPSDRIEYKFTDDYSLQVPGDWNTQKEKLYYYEGTIWYKKDFDYALKKGKRLFVYFGAVNYQCHVYLNGKKLGEHEGGFTPFMFEITDLIEKKGNFIVLKVDNTRKRESVPTVNTDWWNYGGITRRVMLIETSETYIHDYQIQLNPSDPGKIVGYIKIDGQIQSHNATIQIKELKKKLVVELDREGYGKFNFDAKPNLWSPENPKRYTVSIQYGDQILKDQIGFRTIETKQENLLLNGKKFFLKGICIHEEAPLRGGRAFSKEDARILLTWAKELGCNFVRLAHYPHHEWMTRMADEMGMLVWSEIPVYWTVLFDQEEVYKNAENQLIENIRRDKNRASIILWSVANETPMNDSRTQFLTRLAKKAKSVDPTRLTTAALLHKSSGPNTEIIDDPMADILDVIGINEYIGWYDGLPEKCGKVTWENPYQKPLIISETGGGALYGFRGDPGTRWTEDYQAFLYEEQIKMVQKIPSLRGITPWILMDFRSPRRTLYGIQDDWNRKGLISNRGEKKKAFYRLKSFYDSLH